MEPTSVHGNKKGIVPILLVLTVCICSIFTSYKYKLFAKLKYWEKESLNYNCILNNQNLEEIECKEIKLEEK